ncbi:hypothetical protein [Aliarcobacter butzleri]|uniref:hypothetical protein n=1 Tax=Aliarcobacter butzleri TaxID=28197 RepID=UPI002B246B86|nr:hypothetical protein [Aliarcobacter butzleri]
MINFNKNFEKYLSDTPTDLKTVFININFDKGYFTIYPYFFMSNKEEDFTQHSDWIGSFESGTPSIVEFYNNGKKTIKYYQYGEEDDIFPLIYLRKFHSIKESYIDIIQEFILYFNLYRDGNNFIQIDDGGNEHIVIIIDSDKEVKIKTSLLMEFMNVKNYSLSLNFDFLEYEYKEDFLLNLTNSKYDYYKDENEFGKFQSLRGKKIIRKPMQLKKKDKEYENFIIGVDEYGENIEFSCNHNTLSNYFGANKDNPHYLTPIFFKKEVLIKYYSQTEKYSVCDGTLQCGGMWILRLDMNNPKYITAYLGDLGRDLPYSEQKYWKSFNIIPNGKISEVEFRRSFMAEFTNPTDMVLIFKELFCKVNKYWNGKYEFNLFNPLNEADEHYYKSLRIPLTNEQKDFDEQLSSISKIILESINIKEINKYFRQNSINVIDNLKGINRLKLYIESIGYDKRETESNIGYFNMLYDLRSKMTAHRKSEKDVQKELEKHNLSNKDNIEKIEIIVKKVNETLTWLIKEEDN